MYKIMPNDASPDCQLFVVLRSEFDRLDKKLETNKLDLSVAEKELLRFYSELYEKETKQKEQFFRVPGFSARSLR